MTIWVANRLRVSGPDDDIAAFAAAMRLGDSSTNVPLSLVRTFLPLPAVPSGMTVTTTAQWGDVNLAVVDIASDALEFTYDTTWTPLTTLDRISAAWPTLWFTAASVDDVPEWCGWVVLHAGTVIAAGELDVAAPNLPDRDPNNAFDDDRFEAQLAWESALGDIAWAAATEACAELTDESRP